MNAEMMASRRLCATAMGLMRGERLTPLTGPEGSYKALYSKTCRDGQAREHIYRPRTRQVRNNQRASMLEDMFSGVMYSFLPVRLHFPPNITPNGSKDTIPKILARGTVHNIPLAAMDRPWRCKRRQRQSSHRDESTA